jgi:hypothetical protein
LLFKLLYRDESVRQLEERLSQVNLVVDPLGFVDTNDSDYERDKKAVNEMYHRKEQESEARLRITFFSFSTTFS